MKNKLYVLKSSSLKKMYKTHYFICVGEKNLLNRFNFRMKQFVNISSGTIIESALWKLNFDIEEVDIDAPKKLMIDKILSKKKIKDFITELNNY